MLCPVCSCVCYVSTVNNINNLSLVASHYHHHHHHPHHVADSFAIPYPRLVRPKADYETTQHHLDNATRCVECFESIRTTFDINVKPFYSPFLSSPFVSLLPLPTLSPFCCPCLACLFKAILQRVEAFVQMQKIIRKDYSPDTPNSNQCDALPLPAPPPSSFFAAALSSPSPSPYPSPSPLLLLLDKLVVAEFRVFLASRSKFNFACLTRRPALPLPLLSLLHESFACHCHFRLHLKICIPRMSVSQWGVWGRKN